MSYFNSAPIKKMISEVNWWQAEYRKTSRRESAKAEPV